MEHNFNQERGVASNGKNRTKKNKVDSYLGTFLIMILGLGIIFSYVYQSTKQVYLNYEIVNKNKEINSLNILLMEAKVENERLQTNENIEKVASEKLGMSYDKSDRVIVVKEKDTVTEAQQGSDDMKKISIFMKSLYKETYNQLSQLNLENIINYFKEK